MTLKTAIATTLLAATCITATNAQAAIKHRLDIPAQDLGSALVVLARQAGLQVVYSADLVQGRNTHALSGSMTPDEALDKLLAKTGLKYEFLDEQTVTLSPFSASGEGQGPAQRGGEGSSGAQQAIPTPEGKGTKGEGKQKGFWSRFRLAQADTVAKTDAVNAAGGRQRSSRSSAESFQELIELEEIVVTGTNIRGTAPVGSPVIVHDRDEIERTGAVTAGEFLRKVPENFSSADLVTTSSQLSNAGLDQSGGVTSSSGGTSANIHGLGPAATLTLVNGHRLAPSGTRGLVSDASVVPLSAVERIEVLTDGASAIYGSDAVAGVVNFVLRRDFDGAETKAGYGLASQHGAERSTASQLLGKSWSSGNVMIAYDYLTQQPLRAGDRDFGPASSPDWTLIADQSRHTVFSAVSQDITDRLVLLLDGHYADGERFDRSATEFGSYTSAGLDSEAVGGNAALELKLDTWRVNLTGGYSSNRQLAAAKNILASSGVTAYTVDFKTDGSLSMASLSADGKLFSVPGGDVKLAIGAEYRSEDHFYSFVYSLGFDSVTDLGREVRSAFAEIVVPVIGDANATGWAKTLDVSLAGRLDDYSDFGDTTNPKLGITWVPFDGLALRASYGTSFHAPALNELDYQPSSVIFTFPSPNGPINVLFDQRGGNPQLDPETAVSYTFGFELRPAFLPGFYADVGFYSIKYEDRVGRARPPNGSTFSAFSYPEYIASFAILNPPRSLVDQYVNGPGFSGDFSSNQGGAASVVAILDGGPRNLSRTLQRGLDVRLGMDFSDSVEGLDVYLAGNFLFDYNYKLSVITPDLDISDNVYQPNRTRLNGGVNWSRAGFSVGARINHVGAYRDQTNSALARVDAWTTADVSLGYRFGAETSAVLQGLRLALNIDNVTDEDPPFVVGPASFVNPGYDPTNASPLGRYIAFSVSKQW